MNGAPSFTFLQRFFLLCFLFCLIGGGTAIAQKVNQAERATILAKKSDFREKQIFKNELMQYDLYDFSSQQVFTTIKSANGEQAINLSIGDKNWDVVLRPSNILKEDFLSRVNSRSGIQTLDSIEDYTFEGYVVDQNVAVRITSTPNYFVAYFKTPETEYYIEPISRFSKGFHDDSFVMYEKADVLPTAGTCLTVEANEWDKKVRNAYSKSEGCLEVDYALAADYSMFLKYGSPENILIHVSTILNMVNVDYKNAFTHELRFIISEQMTSTCTSCNPWSSTTKAQDLLKNFDDWGPTGFEKPHDIGSLWTNRNFDGTTVAVAWIGKVCTSKRYNCVQDFTSSYATLRMVNSHELGHNFDAHHDPAFSQNIMAAAINPSLTTWSPESIAEINAHINSRDCLSDCHQDVIVNEEPESVGIVLTGKVWLMGFFDKDLGYMKNDLADQGLLPIQQPFNNEIWNHQGQESIQVYLEDVLDWVLLELRNDEIPDEVIARKAVLINSQGQLMNTDGSKDIVFDNVSAGNYHIAIHHKSHLRIRTNIAHSFNSGQTTNLDFTSTTYPISDHLNEYLPGVAVVYCGDYDQNGVVNFLDLQKWVGSYDAWGTYHEADGNGDGIVNLADIVYWLDYQNIFSF